MSRPTYFTCTPWQSVDRIMSPMFRASVDVLPVDAAICVPPEPSARFLFFQQVAFQPAHHVCSRAVAPWRNDFDHIHLITAQRFRQCQDLTRGNLAHGILAMWKTRINRKCKAKRTICIGTFLWKSDHR